MLLTLVALSPRPSLRSTAAVLSIAGLDAESDSVGPGIYGGGVQRHADGAVVIGKQYEEHNSLPGPVYDGDGYTEMSQAVRTGPEAVLTLLAARPELKEEVTTGGALPLHVCAMSRSGQRSTAALLAAGVEEVDPVDTWGYTPLMRMATNNLGVGAAALLRAGADRLRPSGLEGTGDSARDLAIRLRSFDVLKEIQRFELQSGLPLPDGEPLLFTPEAEATRDSHAPLPRPPPPPPPPPRRAVALMSAVDEDAMRLEYERYRAAVEQPLHNVDESTAQRTQAVRVRGLLSGEDIEALHRAGAETARRHPESTVDRSAWGQPEGTWLVTFLNTDGAFEQALPALHAKVRAAAVAVDRAQWNLTAGVADGQLNYRVAEYHTMRSELDDGQPTGGGLRTLRHMDQGSLLTIDILLTDPADIEGGVLQTLEADDQLRGHAWERGDALVFLSHKYHCVSELTRGTRQVLVCELWQGTENPSPSRDEEHRWRGAWKDEWRGGAAEAEGV